jgi:hypothetical protein
MHTMVCISNPAHAWVLLPTNAPKWLHFQPGYWRGFLAIPPNFPVITATDAVDAAVDQHIADAGCAHFAEDNFLRAGVI